MSGFSHFFENFLRFLSARSTFLCIQVYKRFIEEHKQRTAKPTL